MESPLELLEIFYQLLSLSLCFKTADENKWNIGLDLIALYLNNSLSMKLQPNVIIFQKDCFNDCSIFIYNNITANLF